MAVGESVLVYYCVGGKMLDWSEAEEKRLETYSCHLGIPYLFGQEGRSRDLRWECRAVGRLS